MTVKRGKLVIEITETEGRTGLLKRQNGVGKFLDNIDSMFKRGKFVRAMDGIKMFFVSDEGGSFVSTTFGPGIETKADLSEVEPLDQAAMDKMSDEGGPEPSDEDK